MASADDRRMTAILLKRNLTELYGQVMPIYAQAYAWTLNNIDSLLPDEGEVKAVLTQYSAIKVSRISADNALRDIQSSTAEFTGEFPLYPPNGEPCPVWIPSTTGITFPSVNPISF